MIKAKRICLIGFVIFWIVCDTVNTFNEECLYGFYCDGMYDPLLNSTCVAGSCRCSGNLVQTNCLPKVSNCDIQHGQTTQIHPASVCTELYADNICSHDFDTYHCSGNTNQNYEVHILGLYQAMTCCNEVSEISRIEVVNKGQYGRKVVLVLASTRPVAWYLDMEDGVEIERVVLIHKTPSLATVLWSTGNVKEILKVSNISDYQSNFYGKGRDTIKLLQFINKNYGPITSFTGRFQVQQWRLNIGLSFESGNTPSRYQPRVASTISSLNHLSSHNKPTGTPSLYARRPRYTSVSSSLNAYPAETSVVKNTPDIFPSHLQFFHAFGTLQFHHISGFDYYANGTLKVRAPLTTQLINSSSEIKQSIGATSNSNNQIFSTKIFHNISPSLTKISSSMQTISDNLSKTSVLDKMSSTSLLTSRFSDVKTSSLLVPIVVTSSIPSIVTSSAVMTTPSIQLTCNQNPCHKHAVCTDTKTGVSCACNNGFEGDGYNCDDINECFFEPCPTNNNCENTPGSYSCTCLQPGNCRETRIIGGGKPHSGRVEVFHDRKWGTICAVGWDTNDAQVACRDAGYPYLVGVSFKVGSGKIWLSNVQCNGSETRLSDCSHPGWGNINKICTHEYDIAVECVSSAIRLAGSDKPDEGRVEIYFDGEWGTICDNGWDFFDANIACIELGFAGAEKALMGNEVQDGTGRIWLNNMKCTGVFEVSLKQCSHNGWGNVKCGHNQDAGVKCQPKVSCDFELNTCSWQNIKQDDMFDWQRHQASTPTLLTGPPHDNTRKSKYGTYMYIETTGRKPGDKAWLISPTLQATKNQCLRFYYYMVGTDIGQLNVNIRVTGSKNITRLWNLAGSRKAEWIEASVPLNFNTSSEIIFEAVSGDDQKGDIAIDDVKLETLPCTVNPVEAAPDTDECLAKPCDVNAICTNTIGSYLCTCNRGYTGNGTVCTDFDECTTNPCHMNATCTNTIGAFSCKCNPNTEAVCDDAYRPCGLREIFTQLESKIVGGDAAKKGSWPWMAAIFSSDKKGRISCAGVLINNEWVLTAAHCFDLSQDKHKYTVIMGDNDIFTAESEEQRFGVKDIAIHPAYSPLSKDFDIAMIRLDRPVNYTAYILPICMVRNEFPSGTQCLIAGWGTRTANVKDYPQYLREGVVPIVDRSTCQALYRGVTIISSNMVCAGYTTGTVDACQGDSGGPLMCQQGNKWYLAGLTSFGYDCAAKGYPGVYSNVATLYQWINIILLVN